MVTVITPELAKTPYGQAILNTGRVIVLPKPPSTSTSTTSKTTTKRRSSKRRSSSKKKDVVAPEPIPEPEPKFDYLKWRATQPGMGRLASDLGIPIDEVKVKQPKPKPKPVKFEPKRPVPSLDPWQVSGMGRIHKGTPFEGVHEKIVGGFKEQHLATVGQDIPYTKWIKDYGYQPKDPDYPVVMRGVKGQKSRVLEDIKVIEENIPLAKQNIKLIRQNISLLKGSDPSTLWNIPGYGTDLSREEALKYMQGILSQNQLVLSQSGLLPSLREDVKELDVYGRTIQEYERRGWGIDVLDDGTVLPVMPKATEVLRWHVGDDEELYKLSMKAGSLLHFPSEIGSAIASTVTGDKSYIKAQQEKVAEYSLGTLWSLDKQDYGDFAWRIGTSPAVVEGIVIPTLTLGAGYAFTGLQKGATGAIGAASSWWGRRGMTQGGKLLFKGFKWGGVGMAGVGTTVSGVSLGMAAAERPEEVPGMFGDIVFSLGMAYGGFRAGARQWSLRHPTPQYKIATFLKDEGITPKVTSTDAGEVIVTGEGKAVTRAYWEGGSKTLAEWDLRVKATDVVMGKHKNILVGTGMASETKPLHSLKLGRFNLAWGEQYHSKPFHFTQVIEGVSHAPKGMSILLSRGTSWLASAQPGGYMSGDPKTYSKAVIGVEKIGDVKIKTGKFSWDFKPGIHSGKGFTLKTGDTTWEYMHGGETVYYEPETITMGEYQYSLFGKSVKPLTLGEMIRTGRSGWKSLLLGRGKIFTYDQTPSWFKGSEAPSKPPKWGRVLFDSFDDVVVGQTARPSEGEVSILTKPSTKITVDAPSVKAQPSGTSKSGSLLNEQITTQVGLSTVQPPASLAPFVSMGEPSSGILTLSALGLGSGRQSLRLFQATPKKDVLSMPSVKTGGRRTAGGKVSLRVSEPVTVTDTGQRQKPGLRRGTGSILTSVPIQTPGEKGEHRVRHGYMQGWKWRWDLGDKGWEGYVYGQKPLEIPEFGKETGTEMGSSWKTAQGQPSAQKQDLELAQVQELALETVTTPSIITPTVITPTSPPPPVTPPPPLLLGGDEAYGKRKGKKKKKRYKSWFGRPQGKVMLKTVLADPFKVSESQAKFGSATHPRPTKEIWTIGKKTWWRIPTVELMKEKKGKNKLNLNVLGKVK